MFLHDALKLDHAPRLESGIWACKVELVLWSWRSRLSWDVVHLGLGRGPAGATSHRMIIDDLLRGSRRHESKSSLVLVLEQSRVAEALS